MKCSNTYCLLSSLLIVLLQESVFSQRFLQVQLIRYENPFNLEVQPNNTAGRFCCCNEPTPCNSAIENFSIMDCMAQCQLRFSVCAQSPSNGEEICLVSQVEENGVRTIFFSDYLSLFNGEDLLLLLDLSDSPSFSNDINLVVNIEEESASGFGLVDNVTIPIGACNLSSPATEYSGINGIAIITLAYFRTTTSEEYSNCVDPEVVTQITTQVVTQIETQVVTQTFTRVISDITRPTVAGTPTPLDISGPESSSAWMPIAIVLIVVLGVALIFVLIIVIISCSIWAKRSSKKRDATSYNPVSEEAAATTPEKTDLSQEAVVPKIYMDLGDEVLAAVPAVNEIEEGNPDTDSFTSEPNEEQPLHDPPLNQEKEEPQHPRIEVHHQQDGQQEDHTHLVPSEQDSNVGLYEFEK